jgi:hypothetical protein
METFTVIILIAGMLVGAGLILGAIGACVFFFDQDVQE